MYSQAHNAGFRQELTAVSGRGAFRQIIEGTNLKIICS